KFADPKRAEVSQRYFKTGKGEYAEGDIFIGLSVPNVRLVAKKFPNLDFDELKKLLSSKVHEERQAALFILTDQYKKADVKKKEKIYKFYLGNTKNINNWDLVDLSAHKIVGEYLDGEDWSILKKLARSN